MRSVIITVVSEHLTTAYYTVSDALIISTLRVQLVHHQFTSSHTAADTVPQFSAFNLCREKTEERCETATTY